MTHIIIMYQIFIFYRIIYQENQSCSFLRSNAPPAIPLRVLTLALRRCTPMDGPLDDLNDRDAQIARQLPVISAQRDSLAAVIPTRGLRLPVAPGPASLEVTHHHRGERWELRWRASNHRPHA